MNFTKIQGAGNDFIIIDNRTLKIPDEKISKIVSHICMRKLSVGADGLMLVDFPDGDADFKMKFYNADGTLAEMCGNGARCIAKYAFVNHIAKKVMKFETGAGVIEAEIVGERLVKIKLNNPKIIKLENDIVVNGKIYDVSYIELGSPGVPHVMIKCDNLESKYTENLNELLEFGRAIRYNTYFSKGANVNFYEIVDDENIIIRTYERGVEDFTLACGTGAASTVVSAFLKHQIKSHKVKVLSSGGELLIEIENKEDNVDKLYLIGDTNIIFTGVLKDEDICI